MHHFTNSKNHLQFVKARLHRMVIRYDYQWRSFERILDKSLVGSLLIDVGNGDAGAVLCVQLGNCLAETTGRAGNQGDLSVHICHVLLLSMFVRATSVAMLLVVAAEQEHRG